LDALKKIAIEQWKKKRQEEERLRLKEMELDSVLRNQNRVKELEKRQKQLSQALSTDSEEEAKESASIMNSHFDELICHMMACGEFDDIEQPDDTVMGPINLSQRNTAPGHSQNFEDVE